MNVSTEKSNSRKRQIIGVMLFSMSFAALFLGMILYWVSYAFELGLGLFALLQFLSLYILTDKLKKSS